MSTSEAAAAPPKVPGPLGQILHPVRVRLIVAAVLAGVGSALTLVPLAGIAHIGQIALSAVSGTSDFGALAQDQGAVWQTVIGPRQGCNSSNNTPAMLGGAGLKTSCGA